MKVATLFAWLYTYSAALDLFPTKTFVTIGVTKSESNLLRHQSRLRGQIAYQNMKKFVFKRTFQERNGNKIFGEPDLDGELEITVNHTWIGFMCTY